MKILKERTIAVRYSIALLVVGVALIVLGVFALPWNLSENLKGSGSTSRIHLNETVPNLRNSHRDAGAIPKYLEVSSIGISAPVGAGHSYVSENPFSGTDMLSFPVPETATDVTWWADGSGLEGFGIAILLGHSTPAGGNGVFDHLNELAEGDLIEVVSGEDVNFRYLVTEIVEDIDKSNPEALKLELENRSFAHSIALITCSGEFDPTKRQSVQNTIVFANIYER